MAVIRWRGGDAVNVKRLLHIGSVAFAFVLGAWMMKNHADAAAGSRVFELRTYTTLDGRLDALQARFRNHTTKLFEKHGMTNIGYWVPQDGPQSKNTLIYI